MVINFHAIGEINEKGVWALEQLIWGFKLMGTKIYMTGLTPEHSRKLHIYNFNVDVEYISNLTGAIQQFFTTA
ncbi:hypothetical protein FZC66_16215 [Priestia megaterium]|nr:hypothetical protein FZC66_16215 [Priestia megaterium]